MVTPTSVQDSFQSNHPTSLHHISSAPIASRASSYPSNIDVGHQPPALSQTTNPTITNASSSSSQQNRISTTAVLAGVLGSFGFFVLVGGIFIAVRRRKLRREAQVRGDERRRRREKEREGRGRLLSVEGERDMMQGARSPVTPRDCRVPELLSSRAGREKGNGRLSGSAGMVATDIQPAIDTTQEQRPRKDGGDGSWPSLISQDAAHLRHAERTRTNGGISSPIEQRPSREQEGRQAPASRPAVQHTGPVVERSPRSNVDASTAQDIRPKPRDQGARRADRTADAAAKPPMHGLAPRKPHLPTNAGDWEDSELDVGRGETPVPFHPPLQYESDGELKDGRGSPSSRGGHRPHRQRAGRRYFSAGAGDGAASDTEYLSDASVATRQTLMSTINASRPAARANVFVSPEANMGVGGSTLVPSTVRLGAAIQKQRVVVDLPPAYTPD